MPLARGDAKGWKKIVGIPQQPNMVFTKETVLVLLRRGCHTMVLSVSVGNGEHHVTWACTQPILCHVLQSGRWKGRRFPWVATSVVEYVGRRNGSVARKAALFTVCFIWPWCHAYTACAQERLHIFINYLMLVVCASEIGKKSYVVFAAWVNGASKERYRSHAAVIQFYRSHCGYSTPKKKVAAQPAMCVLIFFFRFCLWR